jgi:hypothetical protein
MRFWIGERSRAETPYEVRISGGGKGISAGLRSSHVRGQEFESPHLHIKKTPNLRRLGVFLCMRDRMKRALHALAAHYWTLIGGRVGISGRNEAPVVERDFVPTT